MRIVFVQTYPVYHDLWSTDEWLALENRDRWMPGLVAAMGHDVELWAVDREPAVVTSRLPGFPEYTIRLFEASRQGKKTKFDFSDELVACGRDDPADLFVLKGVDGGAGVRLIRRALKPAGRPFAFVIGGKAYTRHVPDAEAVLYETEEQRETLRRPRRLWRRAVPADRLIRLAKVVDLERFRPMPGVEKTWDVLAVGRLVPRIKSYDALGALPRSMRVAVAGGGPALDALKRRYPWITWLGRIPHDRVPEVMNRARIFVHPSTREFFPRVLSEAAACGVPAVAFADAIAADVLPPSCGLRVADRTFVAQVTALLDDPDRRARLGAQSRAYAEQTMSVNAMRPAVAAMLARVDAGASPVDAAPAP